MRLLSFLIVEMSNILILMSMPLQIKAEKAAAEAEGGTLGGPREVGGFDFDRLIERKPALRQELLTFRDQLLASTSDEQTLKAGVLSAPCLRKLLSTPGLPF